MEEHNGESLNVRRTGFTPSAEFAFPDWHRVVGAFLLAQEALVGDSSDEEHDALLRLVRALEPAILVKWVSYSQDLLIHDFRRWSNSSGDDLPDYATIDEYITQGRPLDSNPFFVRDILYEWADQMNG